MIKRKHAAPEKVFSLRVKWFNLTMSSKLAVLVFGFAVGDTDRVPGIVDHHLVFLQQDIGH